MAIRDLSDPQAVIDAMSEYDQIGQDEFLRTHGFGHAVNYFVQWDGNFYDSKAIAGVAHGYQFGEPVAGSQFSGGENIATLLGALGFRVTVPGEWHFRIGAITK